MKTIRFYFRNLKEMFAELESFLFPLVVKFNEYLSNYILVFLLVGVGIWYTIRTKFIQIRCFKEGFKNIFGGIKLFKISSFSGQNC